MRISRSVWKQLLLVTGMALGVVAMDSSAQAQTATANLTVSANVIANCTISTNPVVFTNYDPISGSALDSTGTIIVTCANGTPANVWLGSGANPNGGTVAAPVRRMSDGTNFLTYQLYTTVARSVVWGGDLASSVATTGTGAAVNLTVYGRIPGSQNVPAGGGYLDTVQATIQF